MASILTQDELEEYREVFDDFDADGSGTVSVRELRDMFKMLGQSVDEAELQEMMDEVDADHSGEIDFDEFCILMAKKKEEQGEVDIETELKEVFRMFDRKDRGYIMLNDLTEILKMLSMKLPPQKIQNMITEASSNENGKVYFEDFRYMYFCKLEG